MIDEKTLEAVLAAKEAAERELAEARERHAREIEVLLDAADDWYGYVQEDNAPMSIRRYLQRAIDAARAAQTEGERG